MGCCSSTPSSASSPASAPYDDAVVHPNARAVTAYPPGNDSATAGLTSHAAPGPNSSRRNILTSTDSPRLSSHDAEQRAAGSAGGGGGGVPRPGASSPSDDVPNKPLKPAPARSKVPIPTSLIHTQQQPSLSRLSSFTTPAAAAADDDEHPASFSPAVTGPIPTAPPRITRAQLERERAAFFDTRWAGRPDAWAALRLVCDGLRQADLPAAQAVLDAAGLTCPSGEVWSANADMPEPGARDGQRGWRRRRAGGGGGGGGRGEGGVYDEWGERYQVPLWVVADPEGVEEEEVGAVGEGEQQLRGLGRRAVADDEDVEGADTDDEDEDDIILSKEKGKAPESGKMLKVKARLSDRGTDVVVRIGSEESIAALRRKIKEGAELSPRSRIKIVYLGKILSPAASLSAQGWREGHVVNAMVFRAS